MIRVVCDICLKNLQATVDGQPQLCERCLPYGEEYYATVQKISSEIAAEWQRRIDKNRNQFLQQKVAAKLKAV